MVLVGAAGLLAIYYGLALGTMRSQSSNVVRLDAAPSGSGSTDADRLTLQLEAVGLDTGTGSLDVLVHPVADGRLAGARGGQLAEPLHIELLSPGEAASGFDFPEEQIVEPVAASVGVTVDAHRFPFDRPSGSFSLEALSQDRPVPIDVELVNETEGWSLAAEARADGQALAVDVEARREPLTVTFTVFYIAGIVVVALITVAIIGGAIVHRGVYFDQVIWLVAMLVVIPAVRNEMPGVPPVGTAVDLLVFLPSVFIVAVALLAAIVVLARDDGL